MDEANTASTDVAASMAQAVGPSLQGGDVLGMLVSTVIVVAAILLLGWFYSRSKFVKSGASDVINIVAMRALGPKERLLIVDVAEQQLLIGITANAVQTLHVFDSPAVSQQHNDVSASPSFADKLRSFMPEKDQ